MTDKYVLCFLDNNIQSINPRVGDTIYGEFRGFLHGATGMPMMRNPDWGLEWMVLLVNEKYIKKTTYDCGFSMGEVVFIGYQKDATDFLIANDPEAVPSKVIGAFIDAADDECALGSYKSHVSAGEWGVALSHRFGISTTKSSGVSVTGPYGTAQSRDFGVAVTEYGGTAYVGDFGVAKTASMGTAFSTEFGTSITGPNGTAVAQNYGLAIASNSGIAVSGKYGYSIAKKYGTAISGDEGISIAGLNGCANSGENGVIMIQYLDEAEFPRMKIGYIGEDGLKPNTLYSLYKNEDGDYAFNEVGKS